MVRAKKPEASNSIQIEIVELAGCDIQGCLGCGYCRNHTQCHQKDGFNALIPLLKDKTAGAIIIGTSVYLGTMTLQCKAFLDRAVVLSRNGYLLRNKVGGVLTVGGVRNGGQELTIQAVQAAMFCHDMVCVSGGIKTAHLGASLVSHEQKGIECDDIRIQTARDMGRRVTELVLLLNRD
jgi:multimeric flavodoxin WrbA